MAQRRKNQTVHEKQKVVAAHYRNEFFRKMKHIIDSFCGKDIYPLIPKLLLDYIYLCRASPFSIKAADNCSVAADMFKDTQGYMSYVLKHKSILLPPDNFKITLNDYYTVYFTIVALNAHAMKFSFPNDEKIRKALKIIEDAFASEKEALMALSELYFIQGIHWNNFTKAFYWFKHDLIVPKVQPAKIENVIYIYSAIAETITVRIDGLERPAFRIGWSFTDPGPEWLSLKPSMLGFHTPFSEMPLKVYVQSHAMHRLLERIDCFEEGVLYFNMYLCLCHPKIEHDHNNNILVEFSIFQQKAGYFMVDVVNGIILVRTFLFITNSGTPEGQRLEKNTGLQKLDKKYLAIDKLSTFMTSGLDKNTEVMKIFRESGCQSLINLYEELKPLVTRHADRFDSELILKYIHYPKTEGVEIMEENAPVVNT